MARHLGSSAAVRLVRLALVLVALTGMAATHLPWVRTFTHGAVPGSIGQGWVTFVLFALVLPAQLAALGRPSLARKADLLTCALAGGAAAWAVQFVLGAQSLLEAMKAAGDNDPRSVGAGVDVVLGCAAVTFLASLWLARRT
jgi:hypothetical protein